MARGGEQRCSQVLGEAARRCELGIACELAAQGMLLRSDGCGASREDPRELRARAPMAEDMRVRAFLIINGDPAKGHRGERKCSRESCGDEVRPRVVCDGVSRE